MPSQKLRPVQKSAPGLKGTQSNTETDKYGQKQSIEFATFKTPEITLNLDSKVNCVLLGPYMT